LYSVIVPLKRTKMMLWTSDAGGCKHAWELPCSCKLMCCLAHSPPCLQSHFEDSSKNLACLFFLNEIELFRVSKRTRYSVRAHTTLAIAPHLQLLQAFISFDRILTVG